MNLKYMLKAQSVLEVQSVPKYHHNQDKKLVLDRVDKPTEPNNRQLTRVDHLLMN